MKTAMYKVQVSGRTVSVSKSRMEAINWIERKCEIMYGHKNAKIEYCEADILEVNGRVIPGDGYPHVEWLCPACGEYHYTDISPSTQSPGLWYCETKTEKFLFLVSFS